MERGYTHKGLTSASCDLAMSTNVLAAGCIISSSFMIVAPSLDMVALPWESTISLSIPRGPRVVRTASTIDWQALMFDTSWGFPCDVSVPSLRSTICGCCNGTKWVLVSYIAVWQPQYVMVLREASLKVMFGCRMMHSCNAVQCIVG